MRSFLSVVLVLSFAWSQAAAIHCPMDVGSEAGEPGASHAHHAHDGHQGMHGLQESDPNDAPRPHHSTHHETDGCAMVMACGVAAAPTFGVSAAVETPVLHDELSGPQPKYDSPSFTADPPPPRLLS